jgi:hypothetical protein
VAELKHRPYGKLIDEGELGKELIPVRSFLLHEHFVLAVIPGIEV